MKKSYFEWLIMMKERKFSCTNKTIKICFPDDPHCIFLKHPNVDSEEVVLKKLN